MIHFLRNDNEKNILEIECFVDGYATDYEFIEIAFNIDIVYYSIKLVSMINDSDNLKDFIIDINNISEIKENIYEKFFNGQKSNINEIDKVNDYIKNELKKIEEKYDLIYVED